VVLKRRKGLSACRKVPAGRGLGGSGKKATPEGNRSAPSLEGGLERSGAGWQPPMWKKGGEKRNPPTKRGIVTRFKTEATRCKRFFDNLGSGFEKKGTSFGEPMSQKNKATPPSRVHRHGRDLPKRGKDREAVEEEMAACKRR